jgi:hypothetical protein
MESSLRALLTSYAPLTAIVPAARIVWNHLPQATVRPAIVLFKISGAEGVTMAGPDGLAGTTVQIDVQATGVTEMWAIRDLLIARLHGHKDATFRGIFLQNERQTNETLTGGTLIHRASLDFSLWASA